MNDTIRNDLEVSSKSVVMQTAKEFAQTIADSPHYKEFEKAYLDFRNDVKAQNALKGFQKKQSSLRALMMLNAVSDVDRKELQRLQDDFYHQVSVLRYSKAQEDLVALCQEIGDQLSQAIGLDYASACRTGGGCCG